MAFPHFCLLGRQGRTQEVARGAVDLQQLCTGYDEYLTAMTIAAAQCLGAYRERHASWHGVAIYICDSCSRDVFADKKLT